MDADYVAVGVKSAETRRRTWFPSLRRGQAFLDLKRD